MTTSSMYAFFCEREYLGVYLETVIKSFVEERSGRHFVSSYCKNPRGCAGVILMADDAGELADLTTLLSLVVSII